MESNTLEPVSTKVRRWVPAVVCGLVAALAFAAVVVWRNPDKPVLVSMIVYTFCTWPILTWAFQMLVFDREGTNAEIDAGKETVERAWSREAAETAFFALMGGLLLLDTIGNVFRIGWLDPIGMVHVYVLGLGTYAASYLWLRVRGS